MKKIVLVFLTALLAVTFAACDDGGPVIEVLTDETTQTEVPEKENKEKKTETPKKSEKPKSEKKEKPQNIQGYIGMKKSELEKLFGKKAEYAYFFDVPYFVYQTDKTLEFSFGLGYEDYSEVPANARCFSVVTKVKHLIDCSNGVSQRKLEAALGMPLTGPEFSDEICYYVYGGKKDNFYCTVYCGEDRMNIMPEDFLSYSGPQYDD